MGQVKGHCGPFEFPALIVNATSSGASIEELENGFPGNMSYPPPIPCYTYSVSQALSFKKCLLCYK